MTYISRRISVTNEKGEEDEYSDTEFFSIDASLIVLGEPGAGKSELLILASKKFSTQIYNAPTVEIIPEFDSQSPVIIIDGVDEVTAYEKGTPVNKILAKLPIESRFILSCRAADWQDTINTRTINQKWQQSPIIGRILPLNHQEIIDFVNANGDGLNGEKFLKEAQQHDVVDLLKNPQNLLLLLKSVQISGWPDTRLELYENASNKLVQEINPIHNSINRAPSTSEKLIEAAGFIFAQLLLYGKTIVRLDGQDDAEHPKASELASKDVGIEVIQSALSTKLFRLTGANLLEPCHRTVAEFLAAKWIAKALQNQLSLRHLEIILCGSNDVIPSALRGLHAWIATLNTAIADKFIKRDPYGFLRYGDPTVLSVQQSKSLLDNLEKAADIDPYFRNEDWHTTFGKGLARKELRADIIRIICNPKSPYQLSLLIIESIKGDDFADDIANDLFKLVIDASEMPSKRDAALDVLIECKNQSDWGSMVKRLRMLGDAESLIIALNVVQSRIEIFNGKTLADIILELDNATSKTNASRYIGTIRYGLHKKLSTKQLEESLDILSETRVEEGVSRDYDRHKYTEDCLLTFIQERFERGSLPPADKLWYWLKSSERCSYHRSGWDCYSTEYFSQNIGCRQSLQAEAIKSTDNTDELQRMLFYIGDICPGLLPRENDLIFHLNNLLENKDSYPNWDQRWKIIVRYWWRSIDVTEEFKDFVRNQALQSNSLSSYLSELEKPPEIDEYTKKHRERQNNYKKKKQRERNAIRQKFEKIQNKLGTGQLLSPLCDVSKAYLGRISDFKEINDPTDRVIELVGSNMAPVAFTGLSAAMARDDIPSAREIIELHANESKRYYFEDILLAHCAIKIQSSRDLSDLPLNILYSALAACHWGLNFSDDYTSSLQKQLENIVFTDKNTKETFVRDTIEPYLNAGTENISGLYHLVVDEEFSDIAGPLSIEWIENYTNLSSNSLQQLLIAAIRYGSQDKMLELIQKHISSKKWNDEEQRNMWVGTAFLLDFDNHMELLNSYAAENKDHLWSLRMMSNLKRRKYENWPHLSAVQHYFLITKFGSLWTPEDHPSGGWSGDQNPWDASDFIHSRISDLSADLSDQAEILLSKLIDAEGLDGYQNHIKHLYSQQTRMRAEANKVLPPLSSVKSILSRGDPVNNGDLQALLTDELLALEDRIRNSTTKDFSTYWKVDKNGDKTPHDENDCRNLITSAITPYLERYNVRSYPEGVMPNDTRCDLLNTHGLMNLPIEIKGQWHGEIWTAAKEQLQNYTKEYHSDGRGIYLVLWFGYLKAAHSKNPRGWKGVDAPKALDEMKNLLKLKYKDISDKTKIMVLDLSQP